METFEGFNFRTQSAIDRILTAAEVVAWNHDRDGEAEFWPSGDRPEVALLFRHNVLTAFELAALDRLLTELKSDTTETLLRIHYAMNICGAALIELTAESLEEHPLHIFVGTNFADLRREAAYDLFELYYPEEYPIWEKSTCDGLIFDTDRFLDSPTLFVEEVTLGEQVALLVALQ